MERKLERVNAQMSGVMKRVDALPTGLLLFVLNVVALLIYSFIALRYNYLVNAGRLMFSTPDTWVYREVGNWLLGKTLEAPISATLVPFLYPLFVGIIMDLTADPYAVWIAQLVLWLLALNLTALNAYVLTKRRVIWVFAFCVFMLNASLIVLTFYALSETLVVFLLSLWTFFLAKSDPQSLTTKDIFLLTFVLGLLTVVKPVFQLPLGALLLYVLANSVRTNSLRNFLMLLLALSPVLMQSVLMRSVFGTYEFTRLSDWTVRKFYLAQVYAAGENIPLQESRSILVSFDSLQMFSYLMKNPALSLGLFLTNVKDNLTGGSVFLEPYLKPYVFTLMTDVVYLIVHVLCLPVMVYSLWAKQSVQSSKMLLLWGFSILVIFASGLSFGEGDRLTVVTLPLWLISYLSISPPFSSRSVPTNT